MNRQLQANGGIMQVAPREKFGLGSSLKKFARKIIPNEIADIAVKAAPFVAPFNPAVAAAMAGIGSFDQTGSIGGALKRGALTYGGGQLARYAGGAGFQGNPFAADGGAFRGGLEGFKGGFSSPLGNQTGFKLGKPIEGVEGVGIDMQTGGADGVGIISDSSSINTKVPLKKPIVPGEGGIDLATGGADAVGIIQDTVVDKTTVAKEPGFLKKMFDGVANQDFNKITEAIGENAKKFGKAMFTNKDGSIDKAAVLGALAFTASYAEARALAADTGVDDDLTEDEYNEILKDEKKEEYAGYLTNFFGGRKDGGRMGFESGANEMIKTQLLEDIMPTTGEDEFVIIMTEEGPKMVLKSNLPSESMMIDTTTSIFGDAGRGRKVPEEFRADGGRIGFKKGSPEESSEIGIMAIDVEAGDDEDMEDMDMAAAINFSRQEKSYLFKRLGGSGGPDRSYTMPNLYRILSNPGRYPEDAAILKEIAVMGLGENRADGGRIGFSEGMDEARQLLLNKKYLELLKEYSEAGLTDADSRALKEANEFVRDFKMADGGRIEYKSGANRVSELLILRDEKIGKGEDVSVIEAEIFQLTGKVFKSVGGIGDVPTGKIRQNSAGVIERDYRDEGGFVPVGVKERADDVPAMLSKNEFVMTADAVRGIGGGDVEKGSKKLYNTMKQAEKVGKA